MRTRKDIEVLITSPALSCSPERAAAHNQILILEVLLDIRDLLKQKQAQAKAQE